VRSVRAMEKRYHVDALQADRVEATATALLEPMVRPGGILKKLSMRRYGLGCELGAAASAHVALQHRPAMAAPNNVTHRAAIFIGSLPSSCQPILDL